MQDLEKYLDEFLASASKVTILGAGSELMADDAAGILVTGYLSEKFKNKKSLQILSGCSAPENFTGDIKNFKPDTLIVLDAADLKEEPGSIMIIDPDVIEGVSFSTHMLPLKVMLGYLKSEINCRVLILGIQPVVVVFGKPVTKVVLDAVEELKTILEKKLEKFD